MKVFTVQCRYCANIQQWTFEPDAEFKSMEDVLEYDFEYTCEKCGCSVRVYDGMTPEDLSDLGYEYLE